MYSDSEMEEDQHLMEQRGIVDYPVNLCHESPSSNFGIVSISDLALVKLVHPEKETDLSSLFPKRMNRQFISSFIFLNTSIIWG